MSTGGVAADQRARFRLLSIAEGGRATPVFDGYRPDVRRADGTELGQISVTIEGAGMLLPGQEADVTVRPLDQDWTGVPLGEALGVYEGTHRVAVLTLLPA